MIDRLWRRHVSQKHPTADLLLKSSETAASKAFAKHHPATCGARCRTTSGGYEHWFCQRGRFHFGSHRFNNYTWRRVGLGRVHYEPEANR